MPKSKNLFFDENSSSDSLLEKNHKSTKTTRKNTGFFSRLCDNIAAFVSSVTTTKDIINKPHRCLSFAYFIIDKKSGKNRFSSLSSVLDRWFTILGAYFKQIGFGNSFVGFLVSVSLLPVTVLAVAAFTALFWIITIPQLLFAPITFGISLITLLGSLIVYAFVLFMVVVVLVSLWIGLIAALFGVGFVYNDEECRTHENSTESESDSDECNTTKYSCGTTTKPPTKPIIAESIECAPIIHESHESHPSTTDECA